MKFRKKLVVIEAERFGGSCDKYDMFMVYPIERDERGEFITIPALEGDHRADVGDWIITGVKGEKYPCKPDIFEQTYEGVSNEQA